jgi:hypothetical protein
MTPKPKKALPGPKQINCKTCEKSCLAGKRGLCDSCYAKEQQAKAKKREITEKAKVKKTKLREKKANSISKLRDTLDQVFSKYIRLRDTDKHGYGYCIDCRERIEWKNVQCGHFISRQAMATRWDEQNCQAQKDGCNMFKQGRQFEFGIGLDHLYGPGTAEQILTRSREIKKWAAFELKEMIQHYNEKVAELLKSKQF